MSIRKITQVLLALAVVACVVSVEGVQAGLVASNVKNITFHAADYDDLPRLQKAASALGAGVLTTPEHRGFMIFSKSDGGPKLYIGLGSSEHTQDVIGIMQELGYTLEYLDRGIYFEGGSPSINPGPVASFAP